MEPLAWWKEHAKFLLLAVLVKKLLGILGTSVPAEQVFSVSGLLVNDLQASLTARNLYALVFCTGAVTHLS